jgi:1-acyl-sn-glycerol-3-phosphate acyltransferase
MLTLAVVVIVFLIDDLIQRFVISPLVRLRPKARQRTLAGWSRHLADQTVWMLSRLGGAKFDLQARIPARPGVLILMNHQSLMDIPVLFKCLDRDFPRIVTRARYGSRIPLISGLIRLLEYPTVRPGRMSSDDIESLARVAATSSQPVGVFPEGHRTRTGQILPFKKAGIRAILETRPWTVYLVVADGLWHFVEFKDFVRGIGSIRARTEVLGPYSSPESPEDFDAFLDDMRGRMVDRLEEMRGSSGA